MPLLRLLSAPPPSLAGVAPDVEEWKPAGLECTNSDGSINDKGDPVLEEGYGSHFYSNNTTLGTEAGQCDCLKVTHGGGDVEVGVCGGGGIDAAFVRLQDGTVDLYSHISHDGKTHYDLSHNKAIFTAQPGQTAYFRVSRVEVGQFTAEMMVEGGPWGHLTPNGEPLLPKTKEGEAMEGMRLYVFLGYEGATVSDLRVGNQRKKPMKSANKRVQGVDAEGERAAVPRHYPLVSPFDAISFPRPLSLSFFFLFHCGLQKRAQARGLAVHRQALDTDRKSLAPFTASDPDRPPVSAWLFDCHK